MARSRSHTRRTPRSNPRGVVVARPGGYGFVQTSEGEFFIPAKAMAGAFDGDLVEIAPASSHGAGRGKGARKGRGTEGGPHEKPTARVLRVVERAHDTVIGRYEVAEPFGVVVPEDKRIPYDIFTMRSDRPDIEDGSLVRVRILQFPTRKTAATGVVEEVFGMADDGAIAVDLIVARHKLETEFSEASLAEARVAQVDEIGALAEGYRDIRDRFVFTIDPADAKDFDDAISLEFIGGPGAGNPPKCSVAQTVLSSHEKPTGLFGSCGTRLVSTRGDSPQAAGGAELSGLQVSGAVWRLGVHIADVSHYVPWDSSIDLDARRRATSVYLVDRVIPMIPHELSDDLCSLKPHETRRCMTVDLYLDDAANVVRYEAYPALMRSSCRLTYGEADELLRGLGELASLEEELAWRLRELSRLAKLRAAARAKAGGIDFSATETKVRLDDEGNAVDIVLRCKTDATELIEEAMILANETVAAHLAQHEFPCMYRVHEKPSADSLAALIPVFQEFPWFTEEMAARLVTGNPRAIQAAMAASAGRPEEELVSSLLLRSMKRALYRVQNDGHYGLASNAYAHFTSPIRRYPDLVLHRMLKAQLKKRPEKFGSEVAAMPWIAEHSSDMERIADTAARESQELKIIEYLQQFVGTSFSGIVSGVATYGLYVRLENTAEGFLPIRMLGGEYFSFDPARYMLVGHDTGKTYRLGQRIAVVLSAADSQERKLEFRLAGKIGKRVRR